MKKKTQTTQKDFELFQKECRRWIDKYNLHCWASYFVHEKDLEVEGVSALSCLDVDLQAMQAVFRFSTNWGNHAGGMGSEEIKSTAREEVRHLLMAKYRLMMFSRNISEERVNSEEHAIIYALEHADKH